MSKDYDLLPFIAMFAVMWFFAHQTSSKATKRNETDANQLKRGDKVITIGGIHGTIDAVDDSSVFLKVADGTTIAVRQTSCWSSNDFNLINYLSKTRNYLTGIPIDNHPFLFHVFLFFVFFVQA